jgi:hypothetical protein
MPLRALLPALLLCSCSTLPRPEPPPAPAGREEARQGIEEAARHQGDPWSRAREVTVTLEGRWSRLATRLQPVLTDPGFRVSSRETYRPASGEVHQLHRGPAGTKEVHYRPSDIGVSRNGLPDTDAEALAAAALVADAYQAFLFGPSLLAARGDDLSLLPERRLAGRTCRLIAGRLRPGFGFAREDRFIAWIGRDDRVLHRLQFTLNGLESTRGADVDVVFSDHRRDARGFLWPHRFTEDIQRPLRARAHQWEMTSVSSRQR